MPRVGLYVQIASTPNIVAVDGLSRQEEGLQYIPGMNEEVLAVTMIGVLGASSLGKVQRIFLGVFVLLVVVSIWVASAELSKFVFQEANFKKPFFTTYFKNSMFIVYLMGFLFCEQWRYYGKSRATLVVPPPEETTTEGQNSTEQDPFLGEVKYQPLHYSSDSEKSSVVDDDSKPPTRRSSTSALESLNKSVRFCQVAEVRQLSDSQALEAALARLSYDASLRAQEIANRAASRLSVKHVAKMAAVFSIFLFFAQLAHEEAMADTFSGIVNVLLSTASAFTLVLAAIFPSSSTDRFSMSKMVAVLFSIGGVVLVCMPDLKRLDSSGSDIPLGIVWALCSSVLYSVYFVMLRRKVNGDLDKLDLAMFLGFVGLFTLLLMWPGFFVLHMTQQELFVWPSKQQFLYLTINALISTATAHFLWLWGCFLTNSLVAILAVSLAVPLSMLADAAIVKQSTTGEEAAAGVWLYVGIGPIFLSFIAVVLFTSWENWDPCLLSMKKLLHCFCRWRINNRLRDVDREQMESLMAVNGSEVNSSSRILDCCR